MEINLSEAAKLYSECGSLHKVAKELHTSHIKLSKLFKENGIAIQNVGKRKDVDDSLLDKIICEYMDKNCVDNTMDGLSKKYGIRIKKLRRLFKERGVNISKWRFHKKDKPKVKPKKEVVKVNYEYKVCPYCGWKTSDVLGKAHAYQKHLEHFHNVDFKEHLKRYPEDEPLVADAVNRIENKVRCKVCGKYLWLIDDRHLKKHGMTTEEYVAKYGSDGLVSKSTHEKLSAVARAESLAFVPSKEAFRSSYERSLEQFITSLELTQQRANRSVLGGLEIDILVEEKKVGFEIDGLLWHSEWFGGKTKEYHLYKTDTAASNGYSLIHIFEDEIKFHGNVVYNRIRHILGKDENRIYARKCEIGVSRYGRMNWFLDENHVQGRMPYKVAYHLTYNGKVVAVMTFRFGHMREKVWEISRYATVGNCTVVGGPSRLFKHFLNDIKPNKVISYADRRWTPVANDCVYSKIGMRLESVTPPSYWYLNNKVARDKRISRLCMTKKLLAKKYRLPSSIGEADMAKLLGYDRIWDCGHYRFVWEASVDGTE